MAGRRLVFSLGLAVAFAAAAGTALAVTQGGESQSAQLSRPTGILAQGEGRNGDPYELSRIDPAERGADPEVAFCTQIRTPAAAAQACAPVPDADGRIGGRPWRPSLAVLGTSRFFTAIAPDEVTAMEVQIEGEAGAATSRSIDAGPAGKLLMVTMGGPVISSRNPASARDYTVRLLDASGQTVDEATMSESSGG